MTRSRVLAVAVPLGLLAAVLVRPRPSAAQERPGSAALPARVLVRLPACGRGPFDPEQLVALVRTELASDGIEQVDEAATGPAAANETDRSLAIVTLEVQPCDPETREVVVTIDDSGTRKQVRRVVDIADLSAAARPRALALAVAELLRASWAELVLANPAASAASVPPAVRRAMTLRLQASAGAPRPPVVPAATAAARSVPEAARLTVETAVALRMLAAANAAMLGGRLSASIPLAVWTSLRVRLDAGAHAGSAFDRLGAVDLRSATGGLALSIAGAADSVQVELGPRVEVGWSWVDFRPSDPAVARAASDSNLLAIVSFAGWLHAPLGRRWRAGIGVDLGYALVGLEVRTGGRRLTAIAGPVAEVRLALALAP